MKNVMKLSLLGLALTIGAESAASATMARVMTRGSKLVNLASSHKLATAGILVGGLFALDLLKNKALPYAQVGKAKVAQKWSENKFNKLASPTSEQRAEQTRLKEAVGTAWEKAQASTLVTRRLARFAWSRVQAGANWAGSKVPSFRKSAKQDAKPAKQNGQPDKLD